MIKQLEYIIDTKTYNFYLGFKLDFTVDGTYLCMYADADLNDLQAYRLSPNYIFLVNDFRYSKIFKTTEEVKEFVKQQIKHLRILIREYKYRVIKLNQFYYESGLAEYKKQITNLYKINKILKTTLCTTLQI